jgi:CBS domain-containing protein
MSNDLALYTIFHTATIREAMEKIEANRHRVVVVVDDENRVLGTVSDGDVRRAFLQDVMPISPVSRIMQLNPHVTTEQDPARLDELIKRERVTVLPIVTKENELIDVVVAFEPDFDS